MRHIDMQRIQRCVKELADSPRTFTAYISGLVGTAVGFFVAWLTWNPAYGQMDHKTKEHYAYVGQMLGFGPIVLIVIAAGLLLVNRHISKQLTTSARTLAADVDANDSLDSK